MKSSITLSGSLAVLGLISALALMPLAAVAGSDRSDRVTRTTATKHSTRLASYRYRRLQRPEPQNPGIIYYDFPYYYSRGFYPTHIKTCLSYPCLIYRHTHASRQREGADTAHAKRTHRK